MNYRIELTPAINGPGMDAGESYVAAVGEEVPVCRYALPAILAAAAPGDVVRLWQVVKKRNAAGQLTGYADELRLDYCAGGLSELS